MPIIGDTAKAKEIGLKGHEHYKWESCPVCGKERWKVIFKRSLKSPYCRSCTTLNFNTKRKGELSPMWKGGRRIMNGYVIVYLPDGHRFCSMRMDNRVILEHRLVMAEHLGRALHKSEIVHHKDGNRSNNKIENLEITSLGKHAIEHGKGYQEGFKKGYLDGLKEAQSGKITNNN